jgi:UDP-N-acetyl-alpha-D-muramoyl-L-alanyl-L-glutamate epimerase
MDHDQFIYTQFRIGEDRRTAYFDYTSWHTGQEFQFTESLEFPTPLLDTPEQQRSLRALHLGLGVSYYKKFLPPSIVHPYAMNADEAAFWNNSWQNGLGEFLYVNKLDVSRLASFATQDGIDYDSSGVGSDSSAGPDSDQSSSSGVASTAILGIGGGKDSIVAGELLKDLGVSVAGFVMATGEQLGQAASVASTMGVPLHAVKRQLDMQLVELKSMPGTYSGHVPISMIFGLVGAALATAQGASYVVVANEASASIPRITWNDHAVNHQWSKSYESEKDLQQFIRRSVSAKVTYFSAIRELTSIGVAKLFAKLPQYFEVFTSDNSVFRIDPAKRPNGRWGLESPKSLSSYLLLAPWLTDAEVQRIFTIDFLNEPSLETLFLELTGVQGEPPLDCVGTVEELTLSVNLLARTGRYNDTVLMKLAQERGVIRENDWEQTQRNLLQIQPDQALPANLRGKIHDYLMERLAA